MDGSSKVVAVLRKRDSIASLEAAIEGLPGIDLDIRIGEVEKVVPTLTNGHAPDILLVDLGFDDPHELAILGELTRHQPAGTAIIATARQAGIESIRRLIRLGIVDFVPQPFTQADLKAALDSAQTRLRTNQRPDGAGMVITFAHVSGGAGATTLAVQTAIQLREKGRKAPSVCLLDFDLQNGNAGFMFDLANENGLLQILEDPDRLDEAFLSATLSTHRTGVNVLPAPLEIVPLEGLTPAAVRQIIGLARQQFDYVIVDTPNVWTLATLEVFSLSDLVSLVITLDVASAQRSVRLFKLLQEQDLGSKPLLLVANRCEGTWAESRRKKKIERALGRKIDCIVRDDEKTLSEAQDIGVPVREIKRGCRFEKDVRALVGAPLFTPKPAAAGLAGRP